MEKACMPSGQSHWLATLDCFDMLAPAGMQVT